MLLKLQGGFRQLETAGDQIERTPKKNDRDGCD